MSDIDPAVVTNIENIRKVWGDQSPQFKDAVRSSGLSQDEVKTVLKKQKSVNNEKSTAKSAAKSTAKSTAEPPMIDLTHKLYNLVIRTKPS